MTSLAEALTGAGGIERPFHCPVHGDTHPSASVNVISGLWVCYSCGAKGKAGDNYSVDPDQLLSYLKGLQKKHEQHYFPESWLNLYTAGETHEYWLGRFSQQACEHFQLGYDEETESATYPLRDAGGLLLGVVRRPLSPDWDGGKYIYPKYVDVTQYLFNYTQYEVRKRVLLVEGAADAIAAWEAGYEAYAIYGSRMTEAQIQLLRRVGAQVVFTAFDRDEAGEKCHWQVVDKIKDMPVNQVLIPEGSKDLAELSIEEREQALSWSLGEPDHERVVSTTCESASQAPQPSAPTPSASTSGPGMLRIRRTRP
jgi:hypothetical protein